MSSIVADRGVVHYEAFRHGRPVILLHGWFVNRPGDEFI